MSLPLVSPELPDTMPIILARVMETDDGALMQRYLETANCTCYRISRPVGYLPWVEFLKAARDTSPEKLQSIARIVVDYVEGNVVWIYLAHTDFSYEIAAALLREMNDNYLEKLRSIDTYRPTSNDFLEYKRLSALLHPDV